MTMRSRELSARLRVVCDRLRELLSKVATDEVQTRHRVGQLLAALKRAPGKYGSNAVARLAVELGCDAATLYRHASVAERWSFESMQSLAAKKNAKGMPLSWSHWVELARVDSDDERDMLLRRALAESLSVRKLAEAIDDELDHRHAISRLGTMRQTLVMLTAQAERLSAQLSGELSELFDADANHRGELDALISRAIRAHAGLSERARSRIEELVKIRERMSPEPRTPSVGTGLLIAGGSGVPRQSH